MKNSRREWLVSAAGLAAPAWAWKPASRVLGANDRIRVGCIGVGGNGYGTMSNLLKWGAGAGNYEIGAVSDLYTRRKERARGAAKLSGKDVHHDYRDLLARADIDAVFVSVPDHWHAPIALDAMAAGKDVYLQKPMTLTVDEARQVAAAAKKLGRVLQVGSQHLSDRRYAVARDMIAAGEIGTLLWAQGTYSRNSVFGEWNYRIDDEGTEANIDWKRWLGPAPKRPFSQDRYFRWRKYWDYSGGIATDLLYHRLGPLLYAMGPQFPTRISAHGGIYVQKDREVPDTYATTIEYPEFYITMSSSMANESADDFFAATIYGNKGTVRFTNEGVEVHPEGVHAGKGAAKRVEKVLETRNLVDLHAGNFFDCMRSRMQPVLHAEFGYQVMTAIGLGVESYREGATKLFDPAAQRVVKRAGARAGYEGDGKNHEGGNKRVR